jgi:hypothetical protein
MGGSDLDDPDLISVNHCVLSLKVVNCNYSITAQVLSDKDRIMEDFRGLDIKDLDAVADGVDLSKATPEESARCNELWRQSRAEV